MSTKLSVSEQKLLIYFLALLIFAASYFLVFQKMSSQAMELETENITLQNKLTQLQNMAAMQADVEQETADCKAKIEEIIAKYPADMTTEKSIMIVNEMESMTGVQVTSISFLMDNPFGNVTAVTQEEIAAQNMVGAESTTDSAEAVPATEVPDYISENGITGYFSSLSMNYEANYEAWKDMVKYVNTLQDRTTIPAITATYDSSSGNVSGVVTINLYYLSNTGREYEPPVIEGVATGVSDIFNSSGAASVMQNDSSADTMQGADATQNAENAQESQPVEEQTPVTQN